MELKNKDLLNIKDTKKPTEVIDAAVNGEINLDCSVRDFLALLTQTEQVNSKK